MRAIKRMVAAVMLVTMVFCMVSTTALAASYDNIPVDSLTALNDAFEEKVRRAGRIIAEERGLLLPASAYEQHRNAYAGQNTLNADTQTFYEEVKNNSVTLDDIYQEFPALASEALSTTGLDSSYTEPLVAVRASSDPEFGDYRSKIYYTYYERVETDSVESDTYSGLANLAISIVSIGLKPAQAIVVSVLQAAIGSNTWTSCSDYHLTTLEESCLSGKWGEVYTSGGLLCETDWRGYQDLFAHLGQRIGQISDRAGLGYSTFLVGYNNYFPSFHDRKPPIFSWNFCDFKRLFKYASLAIKSIRLTFGMINAGPCERAFSFFVLIHFATVDAVAPVNSAASLVETMSGMSRKLSM